MGWSPHLWMNAACLQEAMSLHSYWLSGWGSPFCLFHPSRLTFSVSNLGYSSLHWLPYSGVPRLWHATQSSRRLYQSPDHCEPSMWACLNPYVSSRRAGQCLFLVSLIWVHCPCLIRNFIFFFILTRNNFLFFLPRDTVNGKMLSPLYHITNNLLIGSDF